MKNLQIEAEETIWEKLLIFPENSYKQSFDLLIAIGMILDLVFSTYKYVAND